MNLAKALQEYANKPIKIFDKTIPLAQYTPIDLSTQNKELKAIDISNPIDCQEYIDSILNANQATIACGGYLEKRDLYSKSDRFAVDTIRDIHLGMDFWCDADTQVITPIDGTVHSFRNNDDHGNYGPTVVLRHELTGFGFHTLYGHLSLSSLDGLYEGRKISKGEPLGALGTTEVNVGYAPHLHFQLIVSMDGYKGDYPGVSNAQNLNYYQKNCPDPNLLLGFKI